MDFWILFWTAIILFGIGSFVVLVIAIIPLGGKDVWELLRRLGDGGPDSGVIPGSTRDPDEQD